MTDPASAPTPGGTGWWRDLLWLALGFGTLNFFLLGWLPLANPDEARYAGIPREMLAAGDWVMPRLNAVPYFEKPPLVYWTVGLARELFGPGEFAARLTPALFGLIGIFLTYATGRRLYGRIAGLASAIVLGTALLYFVLSRILLLDMAVSVLMSAALMCFILAVGEASGTRRRLLFYGLYASAALATLAKGLIGFLIPGAVMFLWLLVFNQWRRLVPLYLPSGLLVFLAIAAPWHVLAAQRHPAWAEFYFVHEHWSRFTTTAHGRFEPWWFFFPILLLGLFPWMGFVAGAVRESVAGGWARRKENAGAWFMLTWAIFVFLFFSKSQSKLIPYILPVLPPLALLTGAWLARHWQDRTSTPLRVGLGITVFFCGLLATALVVVVLKPGLIRDAEQVAALRPYALAMAAILLIGGIGAHVFSRRHGARTGFVAIVATTGVFYCLLLLARPHIERAGTKELALVARAKVAPADRVYHYWAFFHDFVYYTEQPVGLVSYVDELEVQFLDPAERARRFIDDAELRRQWAGPGRVWLLVRQRDMRHEKSIFADPAFRYHLIAATRSHSLLSNQP
ncbi:MAG: glycosyltransferase family 39 protein [Opitutaceae bacterium]|nr:glycosyltransferase family 39 protein [Opitutaceae bacterium]